MSWYILSTVFQLAVKRFIQVCNIQFIQWFLVGQILHHLSQLLQVLDKVTELLLRAYQNYLILLTENQSVSSKTFIQVNNIQFTQWFLVGQILPHLSHLLQVLDKVTGILL